MVLHSVLVKATSQLISLPLLLRWVLQDTSYTDLAADIKCIKQL